MILKRQPSLPKAIFVHKQLCKRAKLCKQHILLQIVCIPSHSACLSTLAPFQQSKANKRNCLQSKQARSCKHLLSLSMTLQQLLHQRSCRWRPVRYGTHAIPQASTLTLSVYQCPHAKSSDPCQCMDGSAFLTGHQQTREYKSMLLTRHAHAIGLHLTL